MAEKTKILVLYDGEPLVDAKVYVDTIVGQEKETDEDGKIAFDLDSGYVGFVNVLVKKESAAIQVTSLMLLEEGEEHTINIPV